MIQINSIYKVEMQTVTFICNLDTSLGAYSLREGEPLMAVPDGMGKYLLYAEWAEGALARVTPEQVNELAGYQAVH